MEKRKIAVLAENLYWGRPRVKRTSAGVLVLAGSSGRVDTDRVDLLAVHGVTALGLRWFGGPSLPEVPSRVPVEYFIAALDLLAEQCDRLVVMGLSYGAEAALLTAALDSRQVDVVAISPTDVTWEGFIAETGDPPVSKWTYQGLEVPFVPFDREWQASRQAPGEKPAFVHFYEHSRRVARRERVESALIPVDRIPGTVLLIAGGGDQVWPSAPSSRAIESRRAEAGLDTQVVLDERAGHFVSFPGEDGASPERAYQLGGDQEASLRLGAAAWPQVTRLLGVG